MQGFADNGVQGNQDAHGEQAPHAAAHGVDVFLFVELLHLLIIALRVFAVLLLELLHFPGKHVHLNHAPLALDGEGEQDQLDHHGEQQKGHAVILGQAVKEIQDPGKRG